MTPPSRVFVSRAAGVIAAVVALVALAAAPGLATTGAVPPRQEDGSTSPPPASIALVEVPRWIEADGAAAFLVTISGTIEGASTRLRIHRPIVDPDDLARTPIEDVGRVLWRGPVVPVEDLAGDDAGREIPLRSSIEPPDAETAPLGAPGIYPVVVELLDARNAIVATARTVLAGLGTVDDPLLAPSIAVLVDVGARPSLQPDGTRRLGDGDLERFGRVAALLDTHRSLTLTVAATPDTLDALGTDADPNAERVLDALTGHELLSLPYLPLPVDALLRTDLVGLVPRLVTHGEQVLADRIDGDVRGGIWDPVEDVSEAGGTLLSELGFDALLVPSSALETALDPDADPDSEDAEPETDLPLVAAGPREFADTTPLQAIVWDAPLSDQLASGSDGSVDEMTRLVAELILRDRGAATTMLVRPGELAAGSRLARLLEHLDVERAPIDLGGLGLLDRPPDPPGPDAPEPDPDPIAWTGPDGPDLGPVAGAVIEALADLDTFTAIVDEGSARPDDLFLQLATAVSTDVDDAARAATVDGVRSRLAATFDGIGLAGQIDVNLTSRRGTLPVTVTNANAFPAAVLVRVRSDRLAFPDGETIEARVVGEVLRLDVPVEALATGSVPVFVELWSPDGRILLDSRTLNVRSTAISGVGLFLSVGALAVLSTWWIRTWRRKRRHDDGTDPAGGAHAPDETGIV